MSGFSRYLVVAAFLLSAAMSFAAAAPAAWEIAPRTLPAPAGASSELRDVIAASPAPDVKSRQDYPHTREQWDAMIAELNAAEDVPLDELEKQFDVTITAADIAGVATYRVTPTHLNPAHAAHLFFYVHGGAYVFGGGNASAGEAAIIASRAGIPALAIDYRMPPDHPFPAAVDDVVAVYRQVLKDQAASGIAIGGTSAGGGLALAAVHQFKALDLPLPGAIYAGTPWADLTKTGDTLYSNEGIDRVLVSYDGSLGAAARLYADGHDLRDPLLSPVYGEFRNFPPTILITGTRDMFLSDTARTHRKLRAAGVVADLHVYEGMSHAEYAIVLSSPESQDMYQELAAFLSAHLQ